jgi:cell division septal protein FtsQ
VASLGCSEGVPRSLLVVFALAVVLLPLWLTCAQPLVTIAVNEAGLAQVDYVVPVEGNLSVTVQRAARERAARQCSEPGS